MNAKKHLIRDLLEKYVNHQINKDEYQKLLEYLRDIDSLEEIESFMNKDWKDLDEYPLPVEESEFLYKAIITDSRYNHSKAVGKKRFSINLIWKWGAVSAAALFIIITAAVLYTRGVVGPEQKREIENGYAIKPGGNKATLTLANGEKILLSELQSGIVVDSERLTYADGSILRIQDQNMNSEVENMTQTIETPKGGTYQVVLSDGTKVWLNADTKLTFSSKIQGKATRTVKLEGEAYFEVAKDKEHPFIVHSQNQTVGVLGTHFNLSSYKNESTTKTTLLEGLLEVNNMLIKPGQQAIVTNSNMQIINVDASKFAAWKDGKFVFKSENLESIMRKLERWYDVDIVYKGDFTDKVFTGSISRKDNISDILDKISFTRAANFKIEGRRITVMP